MQNGRVFIALFILVVLCLVLYLFKGFWLVIAIGSLLAVSTASITAKFLRLFARFRARKVLASLCTTILLVCFLIAPFAYAITQLALVLKGFDSGVFTQTIEYLRGFEANFLPQSLEFLKPKLNEAINEALTSIDLNALTKNAFAYFGGFTKSSAKILADIVLICVFFFFANLYGTELVIYIKSVLPIDRAELDEILREVGNVMAVVLYSMVLTAVFEGILFAIIAGIFGYDAVLFGIVFAISSLIPAIGGALIYVPLSLYEFASNGLSGALTILLYSIIVISILADTFIKPLIIKYINLRLVKTPTKINELLIFLAMLAGISSFGFWGIILGPAILTFFISTLKMCVILKEKRLL